MLTIYYFLSYFEPIAYQVIPGLKPLHVQSICFLQVNKNDLSHILLIPPQLCLNNTTL